MSLVEQTAADQAYLSEVGMRSFLADLVKDALRANPEDPYAFMKTWASAARQGGEEDKEEAEVKARLIANAKAAVESQSQSFDEL